MSYHCSLCRSNKLWYILVKCWYLFWNILSHWITFWVFGIFLCIQIILSCKGILIEVILLISTIILQLYVPWFLKIKDPNQQNLLRRFFIALSCLLQGSWQNCKSIICFPTYIFEHTKSYFLQKLNSEIHIRIYQFKNVSLKISFVPIIINFSTKKYFNSIN